MALSRTNLSAPSETSPPTSPSFSSAVNATGNASGGPDVILALYSISGDQGTGTQGVTISDNVNSGIYVRIGQLLSTNGIAESATLFYKVANTNGTPTSWTVTGPPSLVSGQLACASYTGFTGTPTFDEITGFITQHLATGATTYDLNNGKTNPFANTIGLVGFYFSGSFDIPIASGWTRFDTWNHFGIYRINSAVGTTIEATGNLNNATTDDSILCYGGVYDFPGPGIELFTATATDIVSYSNKFSYAQGVTNNVQVGPNGAFGHTGGQSALYWNNIGFTADQQSQATIGAITAGGTPSGPGVRLSVGAGGANGYVVQVATNVYNIGVLNNGTFTSLIGGPQPLTSTVGDVLNLTARGSTLTFSKNGNSVKVLTDSTFSTGSPGLWFNGVSNSTNLREFLAGSLGINFPSFQVTSTIGQLGDALSYPLTHQTATFTVGTITRNIDETLGPQTATFLEGQLVNVIPITGQTATFTPGVITASVTSGPVTLQLGQQTAQFNVGTITPQISYILDQNTITLVGQTATFSQGAMTMSVTPTMPAYTVTFTEGLLTTSQSTITLGAQTATFTEGIITATAGANVSKTLAGQTSAFTIGALAPEVDIGLTAETATFSEGIITFSNQPLTITMPSFTATFTVGVITVPIGIDEWTARSRVINAGLIPQIQYAEHATVPSGNVISQTPVAGTVVPVNSPVIIVVSRGPYSPSGAVNVPDFTGLMWKDATDELFATDLSEGSFRWAVNPAKAGSVIAQSVSAGSLVPVATIVQLTLSAGPTKVPATITVPVLE